MNKIIVSACTVLITIFCTTLAFAGHQGPGQYPGGHGMGGPYGYGSGSGMSSFRIADLDGDSAPEIVTVSRGLYLVILDNEGTLKTSKALPALPSAAGYSAYYGTGSKGANSLDVADLDGDGIPEIVTIYHGAYLVILDNQGNLKSYSALPAAY